jgi:acetylglutamate kinase
VKRPVTTIDYGFAGDIDPNKLHVENMRLLLDNKLTPVIAPLTHDEKGQMLNTNADTIASSLAIALSKYYDVRLIYCFEKKGVLEDINKPDSVIHLIDRKKYQELLEQNALADGILPKLDNAFAACEAGVKEVLIGDAADIKQNCSPGISGTLIRL